MTIDWFRDLVICIFGLVLIGVSIFITVIIFLLYRRVSAILDSIKSITGTIQMISSAVEGVAKPVIQIMTTAMGMLRGIDTVSKLFKKKEVKKDG